VYLDIFTQNHTEKGLDLRVWPVFFIVLEPLAHLSNLPHWSFILYSKELFIWSYKWELLKFKQNFMKYVVICKMIVFNPLKPIWILKYTGQEVQDWIACALKGIEHKMGWYWNWDKRQVQICCIPWNNMRNSTISI
jgi:hypothetical protein